MPDAVKRKRLLFRAKGLLCVTLTIAVNASTASAQTTVASSNSQENDDSVSDLNAKLFLRNLAQDQRSLWSSPFRVKLRDAAWLVPLAGVATGLIMSDRTASAELSRHNPKTVDTASTVALVGFGGAVGTLYLLGRRDGNSHLEETGFLSAEAGVNSLIMTETLKRVFRRDRPMTGDGTGHFFRSGASFYSGHAAISWSFASVIAHEYPGWLSKTLAYGAATGISLARVGGQQHFPTDVFVGAVAGYLTGASVYRHHHDAEIDSTFGTFLKSRTDWSSHNAGTTYVPLDNWVYPALERLIAAGYVRYQFLGLRPWTRTAVADMIAEASEREADEEVAPADVKATISVLKTEFADELKLGENFDNKALRLESVYTRAMQIAGPPLNDSYHFGQTIINDFGRPYGQGFNNVTGFTSRAESGRFGFYVRGEYQHAPARAPYSSSVQQVIAEADATPLQGSGTIDERNAFRLLDAYVETTLGGHAISVGKQSLWWGTGQGGAMIVSNNAEPFYTFRINRAVPLKLPSILKYLGPVRYDTFFGRLAGHQFPPRPFMHGESFSFKPTENLELGFSRTAVFAGEGITPLTLGNFWDSLTSTTSSTNPGFNLRRSPGVRHSSFDFSYRVPGLRNWLTLYSDSIVHDDVSPIDAPRRAAINPGIYLNRFPGIPKLDLRIEAVNTDPPITNSFGGRFIYYEAIYKDVYLNQGNLLGSWIGREGKGIQAWSTYWLSPTSTIQFAYRNAKTAKDFIPGGETSNSYSGSARFRIRPEIELNTVVQYERWNVPVLAPELKRNWTTSVQLTFWPGERFSVTKR
jgi:membrane-associated phospholipid phosphatase